ncbi:hypothetical protein HanIR_Chr08g0350911 [Helianthus annuus]|nr:hypothetical protein HanIR_Chr08g0350911 [Helianthus annuus]
MAINFLKLRIANIYRISHDRFGKFHCNTDIHVAKEPRGTNEELRTYRRIWKCLVDPFMVVMNK